MEKLARLFFVFTLLFAGLFITFFLLYTRQNNDMNLLKVERANALQQLNTANAQLRRVELSNQELQTHVDKLEESLASRPATVVADDPAAHEEVAGLMAQIDDLQQQLHTAQDQITQLREREGEDPPLPEGPTAKELELEQEVRALQSRLTTRDQRIQDLEQEIEVLSSSADDQTQILQERVSQLQQNLQEAQQEVERAQNQLVARDTEIKQLQEQLDLGADAQALIESKDEEIRSLEGTIADTQQESQQLQNEISALTDQVGEMDQEIQTLHRRLQAERSLDPIPPGQEGAIQYKHLIMGEDALLSKDYVDSARYFNQARLDTLPLGDLAVVYRRRQMEAYRQAASILYQQGMGLYRDDAFSPAIAVFMEALEYAQPSESTFLDHIRYHLALSLYQSDRLMEAAQYLHAVHQNPSGTYYSHALYYLTRIAFERGDYAQAKQYAESLKAQSAYLAYANKVLSEIAQMEGQP